MKPLKSRKSPVVAAVLAVLFGALGLGIYLRSWSDAGVALAITVAGVALASGIGIIAILLSWVGLAAYAVMRVTGSNEQLAKNEPTLVAV